MKSMREFSSHSVMISALICVSTWVVSSKAALAQDSSVLWLRADKGVNVNNSVPADNTRLVTWFNQQNASFNGEAPTHHAGESSGAMASPLPTMPFYRYGLDHHINFNPVILFDDSGEGNAIEITTPTTLDQTIFAVFKSPGTGRSQYQVGLVYGGDVSDPTGDEPSHRSDMSFGISQGSKLSFGGGFQGDYFTEGDFKLFDIPSIGVLQRKVNGTSNVDFNIFANGSPDELDQRVTNTGSGHPLINRVRIGRHYSGGGKLSGFMAEVMVYDSVLDATSRNIVESYLAIKYGVTLNSTQDTLGSSYGNTGYDYLNSDGNVVWNADLNTLFKYNIAGLGRDDAMSLDQRISQSVNYGSVVKMSTDNDLNSFNLSAARDDITNDKVFLMWAADKSSVDRTTGALIPLLPVSSGNPKGIKSRVDRNWMVQLSNIDSTSLAQVGIEFDLNQLSGFGALAQDQVLLMIDSDLDADYTTGNVEIIEPTSFINNRAVFHDVALTHGAVFSIAIKLTDVQIDTPVMATFSNQFSYPVSGVCTLNAGDVQVTIDDAAPLTKTVSCVANTDPNSSFTGKWSAQMNVSPVASGTGTVIINATQNAQQALPKVADKESNTPPSIDLNGPSQNGENYTASFYEGSVGVAITASDVTVTDAQDTMMASAKITLQNTQAGDDFILPNNINGIVFNKSKNAQGNWEVTLTGVASLADYQAALAGIDFVSVSQKPSTVTRAIEVVVNDGQLNSNIASTQISVADVDDLSAQDDTFTLNENSFISANVADNDSTTSGATLSYSVAENNNVEHGTLVLSADGSYVYTPNKDFVGQDSFKYVVVDQITGEELIQTVTIDVLPVNRPPLASDDRVQINDIEEAIVAVLDNDTDADFDRGNSEKLTVINAKSAIGTVSWTEDKVTFDPPAGFSGTATIEYTIRDAQGATSTAIIYVEVTLADDSLLPIITVPDDIYVDANALFTKVDLGTATAKDRFGNPLPVSLVDGITFYEPGVNTAYWQAVDKDGNRAIASQLVKVRPLVSMEIDQVVLEGFSAKVGVYLNGTAISYPMTIGYSLSGSADLGDDYESLSGELIITNGSSGYIDLSTLVDSISDDDETVMFELDPALNRGNRYTHQVTIKEDAVAPKLDLVVQQAGQERITVAQGQPVTILGNVSHPIVGKSFNYQWSSRENALTDSDSTDNTFTFDTANLAPGLYYVTLEVTDRDNPQFGDKESVYIEVVEQLETLTNKDSDLDGISDIKEGYKDSDGDGLPDYLDAVPECNVLPEQAKNLDGYFIEGDPGVCLRKGDFTISGETNGGEITMADIARDGSDALIEDPIAINVGGIFDYIAYGLPEKGQLYHIVMPQIKPIPEQAVYRKLMPNTGWVTFTETADDAIHSTQGEPGYCPPPGGDVWQPGLVEGFWCVQLTMKDGGVNDADGIVNSTVVDPGGVGVLITTNNPPVAEDDNATTRANQTVTINVLSNDSDIDGDELVITSLSAQFGTVTIENGEIVYVPAPDHLGEDKITYAISDGNGGSDAAVVTVTIVANKPPQANDDSSSTIENMPVEIEVLNNDSDSDGDSLTVQSASADNGTVVINSDGSVEYTPNAEFVGDDTITYQISDGQGGVSTANVSVTVVKANLPPIAQDDTASTVESTAVTVDILNNDSDPDGDSLTVQSAIADNGTVVINSDGSVEYTPNAGFVGDDTITYQISDGRGGVTAAEITMTVVKANVPPIAQDDTASTVGSTAITINILSNDSDSDGDSLTVQSASAGNGTVVINSDGSVEYTPNAGFVGDDTITYQISDGRGGVAAAEVTISVSQKVMPPIAKNDSAKAQAGQQVQIPVLNNDSDPMAGDLTVVQASAENGVVTINADGSVSYTPNVGFSGTDTIIYYIENEQGERAFAQVTMTVSDVELRVKTSGAVHFLFLVLLMSLIGYRVAVRRAL